MIDARVINVGEVTQLCKPMDTVVRAWQWQSVARGWGGHRVCGGTYE